MNKYTLENAYGAKYDTWTKEEMLLIKDMPLCSWSNKEVGTKFDGDNLKDDIHDNDLVI